MISGNAGVVKEERTRMAQSCIPCILNIEERSWDALEPRSPLQIHPLDLV